MKNFSTNLFLWRLTAVLAFVTAAAGVINPDIYTKVMDSKVVPGAFGQDLMTLFAATLLGWLAWLSRADEFKKHIVAFGILGYLFYAYGIYAIERAYNPYYLAYLMIFGLSFWSLVVGFYSVKIPGLSLSNRIRKFSIGVAIFQPVVFYPLWIAALLPLMRNADKIETYYSIYILDLVFIMPAFLILAILLKRRSNLGIYAMPAMFLLGFTLIFSLAVSELAKYRFDMTPAIGGLVMSLGLSLLFLVAAAVHLKGIQTNRKDT